jgi:hypothetical protein
MFETKKNDWKENKWKEIRRGRKMREKKKVSNFYF